MELTLPFPCTFTTTVILLAKTQSSYFLNHMTPLLHVLRMYTSQQQQQNSSLLRTYTLEGDPHVKQTLAHSVPTGVPGG